MDACMFGRKLSNEMTFDLRRRVHIVVNMPEEDRTADIGSMHKNLGKGRACGSGDILADRQTHGLA